eukprot:TRINITY_DN30788_c0_g1_i1.p1 TRINITY_DN30788_c0_g1~~TRINITY_DN30788_c0_g1_i1.p1  ORF type:complete len:109 (-),score=10.67 TRINITY_DN30788_c0_g1_i1:145-471(-)
MSRMSYLFPLLLLASMCFTTLGVKVTFDLYTDTLCAHHVSTGTILADGECHDMTNSVSGIFQTNATIFYGKWFAELNCAGTGSPVSFVNATCTYFPPPGPGLNIVFTW